MAPNVFSWAQASFMTLPDVLQSAQTAPTSVIGQSQLFILMSVFILQRHNLFLLRVHRKDYLHSARRRLNFLPQGAVQVVLAVDAQQEQVVTLQDKK